MVGEPYHGGDFMTLTQRAKDQRVQMTEESRFGDLEISRVFLGVSLGKPR